MYEEKNLLIVIAVLALCAWFARTVHRIFSVYELCDAVSSGAVVRLENGGTSFGELRLLWSTSMQQQLLRSSRKCSGISVSSVAVPWSFLPNSIRFSDSDARDERTRELGISFSYSATVRSTLQVFWGVEHGAVERLRARVNRQHELRRDHQKPTSFMGTRRKRCGWFGARYTAVDSRDTAGSGTETLRAAESLLARTESPSAALFPPWECCGMSEPFHLASGRDCAFEMRFPLTPHRERGAGPMDAQQHEAGQAGDSSAARRGAEFLGIGGTGGGKLFQRRNSGGGREREEADGLAESGEQGRSSLSDGAREHPSDTLGVGEVGVPRFLAAREADAMPDAFPLVMVVSVQGAVVQDRIGRPREERVQDVLFAMGSRRPSCSQLHVEQSIVITNKAAYLTKEVYGQPQKGEDEEECIICLSEAKVVTLLPCRHLCVCTRCLSRLQQCPVCRSSFVGYLDASHAHAKPGSSRMPTPGAPASGAGVAEALGSSEALYEGRGGSREQVAPRLGAAEHPWACVSVPGAGHEDV